MSGGADGKGEGFFAGAFAERGEQLVLHPASNYSDSTAYFAICRVVVSQRRNHSASLGALGRV